ncbi:unnamed protein product [Darwinula stevensoni]|uniref:PIN domain-containing protein n=1 Tax=Darwinula stevensoni TaxID=69355 RepID=A0A7R8XIJ4_9CRUS|nr:unnamed protein product [Darwinula stevensoni]CAG0891345.1 unnamed protein product [Darwinula stevensoni]
MDLREKLRAKRNIKGLVHLSQLNLKQNQGVEFGTDFQFLCALRVLLCTLEVPWQPESLRTLKQGDAFIASSDVNVTREETTGGDTAVKLFIVLDTNIFLDPCFSLDDLVDSSFVDFGAAHIVIPWKVLEELDCLKSDLSIGEKTQKARNAIAQINQYLRSCHPRVVGQTKEKGHSANFFRPQSSFDDSILQSCLSVLKENQPCAVILLSNDVNLGNKAMFHGIASVQLVDLKSNLITSDQGTRFTSPLSCQQEPRTSPQMDQNPACPDPEQSIKYLVELKKVLTRDLSFALLEKMESAVSAISEGTQGDRVISPKGGLPTYGQTIDMELMAMPDPLQCEEDNDIDPVNLPQEVSTSHTIVNAVLGALRLISYNVKVFTFLRNVSEASSEGLAIALNCFFFQLGLEEEAAGRINLKPCQVFQYGQHIETLEMLEPELWTLKDCQAKLGDLLGEV